LGHVPIALGLFKPASPNSTMGSTTLTVTAILRTEARNEWWRSCLQRRQVNRKRHTPQGLCWTPCGCPVKSHRQAHVCAAPLPSPAPAATNDAWKNTLQILLVSCYGSGVVGGFSVSGHVLQRTLAVWPLVQKCVFTAGTWGGHNIER